MVLRLAASLALVGLFVPPGVSQQFDRRARDEPEVVVEAGGRTGTCDILRFTPNGDFLLAAGDDKVVRVWPYSAAGLDTAPGRARALRWRSWRDQLGGIKAVGISPDGKRVAVGGYGLKISSVAIIERETGNTLAITWPRTREGGNNFDAVMAVGFHPDGKRVGFGTADGSLWIWEPEKLDKPDAEGRVWNAPKRAGRFTPNINENKQEEFNFPRSIHFPKRDKDDKGDKLVSVSLLGQVLVCDLTAKMTDVFGVEPPAGTTPFNVNDGVTPKFPIDRVEWSADGEWMAVATKGNLVLLRSADGKRVVPIGLPEDHFARSLAIDEKGTRLAIGVGGALPGKAPRFYMEGDDTIRLYENPTAEKVPEPKTIAHGGRAEALAFHPTQDRLAVAGGDADEVTLLDLANPKKPLSVVRGVGRRLHAVNLSEDGEVIGVRVGRKVDSLDPNDRGKDPWVRFNIPRHTTTADENVKWVGVLRESGGWTIVPDGKSRFVWHAERTLPGGKTERLRLGLDRDLDQAPTCFTFVPTAPDKPPRVLVGHYYGCSLFELDPARLAMNVHTKVVELPKSKLFIGHGAEVTSIVADKRGEWFVTAGADQTVAGWSLADWKAQSALGAAFQVQGGQLVVGPVDVGSPAWEAGLSTGDVIVRLAVDGKLIYDARAAKPVDNVAIAAKALENPQSGVELFFGWTAGNAPRATPTRLKQRPLWKWFPAFDTSGQLTDTVIWMWHGSYYFTKSLHGDRRVGWHVNHPDVAGTPEFHSLERYKHLFLKPDVIAKLLGTRSVEAALKEAAGNNPQRKSFREAEPDALELALKQSVVRPQGVTLNVTVTPLGKNPDLIANRVELWLNDHRYQVWNGQEARAVELTIPASAFRSGDNQITVLAMNPARGRAEKTQFVHNPASPARPELHGLVAGINDYSAHRKADVARDREFGDLARARDDATGFHDILDAYRGPEKYFPTGSVALMLDAKASRKSLTESLDALKKKQAAGRIKPDDLLVVFFAGHGDLLTPDGKLPPPAKAGAARGLSADWGSFVFCCPDYTPAKATTTTVSGEELFDALAGINCRKMVLLDTCHAGGAIETNLLRRCIPNGQGPFVIAACDQSEKSFEDDKLKHGVFTYVVLDALGPRFREADRDTDGHLTPQELFAYVARNVPEVMKRVKPGNTQTPVCFPRPEALPKITLVTK
jgi:WD40 repeat protein